MRHPLPALALSCAAALVVGASLPAAAAPTGATPVPRPGPAALYAPPATTPVLSNADGWDAPPTMVSGTAVATDGEFVYTDYLYDDHGADTVPPPGVGAAVDTRPPTSSTPFSAPTGDLVYPTDGDRYGYDAADLLELRVEDRADALAVRVTLNTMLVPDATAVAIGIDADERTTTGVDDWGHGIGSLGELGLEHVLYTDGEQAVLDGTPVTVATDTTRNQLDLRIPHAVLDPGEAAWRLYAVTGIADGQGGFVAPAPTPSATAPGGDPTASAPPVFNVAFRYEADGDEPMGVAPPDAIGSRSATYGTWREDAQAKALAARDISAFAADVDFGALAAGHTSSNVPDHGFTDRLYVASTDLGEGVADQRPWFLNRIQPYGLYVPEGVDPDTPTPLTVVLHSMGANYNQFQAASPHTYTELADERGSIAITPEGRGPDGFYHDTAELDTFEVWATVARMFALDPDATTITGYSMGGYGTYRLVGRYPDLFARAFPVVGPPEEGAVLLAGNEQTGGYTDGTVDPTTDTTPLVPSFRNVPVLAWYGSADELVPLSSALTHMQAFDDAGLRYEQDVFSSDHLALALRDEWGRGRDFLGDARVDHDPAHVSFGLLPASDDPDLGLVADHAYWVAGVTVRDGADTAGTGVVDAVSDAFGQGAPEVARDQGGGSDPLPYASRSLTWTAVPDAAPAPTLHLDLTNIATVTADLDRARIDTAAPAVASAAVEVTTDGPTTVTLLGAFPQGVQVVDGDGAPLDAEVADGQAIVALPAGATTVRFRLAAADASPSRGSAGGGRPSAAPATLPTTGGGAAQGAVAMLALAALLGRVRRRARAGS